MNWINLSYWFYLLPVGVFSFLVWEIYQEFKTATPQQKQRKKVEYMAIAVGGLIMYELLITVWRVPIQNLGKSISDFEQRTFYPGNIVVPGIQPGQPLPEWKP